MAKFNFNLRDPKSKTDSAIHLVIRWNNNRIVIPLRERIRPKFWETDIKKRNFQRAVETKQFPEYPEFNARLDKILHDAKEIFRKYENDNDHHQPTPEILRKLIQSKFNPAPRNNDRTFFNFVTQLIAESEHRINNRTGKIFSPSTIQVYKNTLRVLNEFEKIKRKRINFDSINLDFYHEFTHYLTKELRLSTNTIGKHIKVIKTFMSEATERGINTNLAFRSKRFQVVSENTPSIYLSEVELEELYKLDLSSNPRIERVRDLFLIGCWTGLRFSDFSNITQENIQDDQIEITTKKTVEPVIIPFHPVVKGIMSKYRGKYPNSLPPAISNVKMNEYLKELGSMTEGLQITASTMITKAGIQKTTQHKKYELLTTHTARRSFATNLYLSGFPSISIMAITGHRTEKAFMRYIKITPDNNAKNLRLHWQNNNNLKLA